MYIVIRLAEIKKGHLYFRAWWPGQPDNAGTREHCLEIRYTNHTKVRNSNSYGVLRLSNDLLFFHGRRKNV
jgi:hypothetical protein